MTNVEHGTKEASFQDAIRIDEVELAQENRAVGQLAPDSSWQRFVVHFYRKLFTGKPKTKVKEVAAMLKAIHAQEDRPAAREKAAQVAAKLEAMRLSQAAEIAKPGLGRAAHDHSRQPFGDLRRAAQDHARFDFIGPYEPHPRGVFEPHEEPGHSSSAGYPFVHGLSMEIDFIERALEFDLIRSRGIDDGAADEWEFGS